MRSHTRLIVSMVLRGLDRGPESWGTSAHMDCQASHSSPSVNLKEAWLKCLCTLLVSKGSRTQKGSKAEIRDYNCSECYGKYAPLLKVYHTSMFHPICDPFITSVSVTNVRHIIAELLLQSLQDRFAHPNDHNHLGQPSFIICLLQIHFGLSYSCINHPLKQST